MKSGVWGKRGAAQDDRVPFGDGRGARPVDCIDVDGYDIHLQQQGTGPPVLLIHGSASDYRTWQEQAQLLGRDFTVFNYSRRHHHPNIPITPGAEYSMRRQFEDLQHLAKRCAPPPNLIANSYGGLLALLLAVE